MRNFVAICCRVVLGGLGIAVYYLECCVFLLVHGFCILVCSIAYSSHVSLRFFFNSQTVPINYRPNATLQYTLPVYRYQLPGIHVPTYRVSSMSTSWIRFIDRVASATNNLVYTITPWTTPMFLVYCVCNYFWVWTIH